MQGRKTPLAIAAYQGHPDVIEVLVKHGANVDEADEVCKASGREH